MKNPSYCRSEFEPPPDPYRRRLWVTVVTAALPVTITPTTGAVTTPEFDPSRRHQTFDPPTGVD